MAATTLSTARWMMGASAFGALMVVSAGSAASLASSSVVAPSEIETVSVPELVTPAVQLGPCPENMALVDVGARKTCVDKYEGSLVEINDDGSETEFSPYEAPNGHRVRAVSRPGVVPQAHISMIEAKRACAASNK